MGKGSNRRRNTVNDRKVTKQSQNMAPKATGGSLEVNDIISKTPEEISKVSALAKDHDITDTKSKPSKAPDAISDKLLRKTWAELESVKRMYGRIKEKYERLLKNIDNENETIGKKYIEIKELAKSLREVEAEQLDKESKIVERDRIVSEKELNAKGGFIKQNREALSQLINEKELLEKKVIELNANNTLIIQNEYEERIKSFETHRGKINGLHDEYEKKIEAKLKDYDKIISKYTTERNIVETEKLELKLDQENVQETKEHLNSIIDKRSKEISHDLIDEMSRLKNRVDVITNERNKYEKKLDKTKEVLAKFEGVDVVSIEGENQRLIERNEELIEQVNSQLSESELARLKLLDSEKKEWKSEKENLSQVNATLKQRIRLQMIDVSEKETNRDLIEGYKLQRDLYKAAAEESRKNTEELLSRNDSETSFPELLKIDKTDKFQVESITQTQISSLEEFCDDLRLRISVNPDNSEKLLYYSARDVRSFLGGIAMTRLHLLQGISGTGKTSLATAFSRAVGAGLKIIKVQAGWRDHYDLLGHFNSFDKRYRETDFIKAIYEAQTKKYQDRIYIVLLDEMNLSKVEQYFADMLSTLELDEHEQLIEIPSTTDRLPPKLFKSHDRLLIPNNIWFVGTANHDETTAEFADKTYDRSHVMELPTRPEQFKVKELPERRAINVDSLKAMFQNAEIKYQKEAQNAIDYLNDELQEELETYFGIGWGNRLEKQMKKYIPVVIASGGDISEGLDHILQTKILRKVRKRHDTRIEHFEKLKKTIADTWGVYFGENTVPERSLELIQKELIRLGVDRG